MISSEVNWLNGFEAINLLVILEMLTIVSLFRFVQGRASITKEIRKKYGFVHVPSSSTFTDDKSRLSNVEGRFTNESFANSTFPRDKCINLEGKYLIASCVSVGHSVILK